MLTKSINTQILKKGYGKADKKSEERAYFGRTNNKNVKNRNTVQEELYMKIFVVDKNVILTAVIALLVVIMLIPLSMTVEKTASDATGEKLPIYSVETEEKKVAVTFNAAWGAEDIDKILETLSAYNCKCTFFVVGTWAEKYPDKVQKIYEAGHEIASHSYDHAHYAKLSKEEMAADMEKATATLATVTGEKCTLFRAPYGEYTEETVRACAERGEYMIQWDVDSLDYQGLSAAEMEARIMPRLRNGSILLFHTGTAQTADALPALLEEIRAEGYSFSTVGDMIYKENYTINHEGRQLKK